MKTLKQAREELSNIEARNEELLNVWKVEARSATQEEDTEYEQNEAALVDARAEVKTLERIEKNTETAKRSVNVTGQFGSQIRTNSHKITKEDCDKAFRAWATGGRSDEGNIYSADKLEVDYKNQFLKLDSLDIAARAMSVGTPADGGYTVSTFPVQGIEAALKAYSNIRNECTVVTTAQGGNFPWATNDDTGNSARIIGENALVTETDLTVGQVVFSDYTYIADLVKVSFQLLNDSSINLAGFIGEALGRRLGRRENLDMTTGNGSGKPLGVLVSATDSGVTTASATVLNWKDVMNLIVAMDPAYASDSILMCNNSTYGQFLKMANSQDTPLFIPSLSAGGYGTFAGHRIVINQQMPSWGSGATGVTSPLVFFNPKKYIVRQVGEILYKRLDERYADYGQIAFTAYHRMDSKLVDAGTHPAQFLTVHA